MDSGSLSLRQATATELAQRARNRSRSRLLLLIDCEDPDDMAAVCGVLADIADQEGGHA